MATKIDAAHRLLIGESDALARTEEGKVGMPSASCVFFHPQNNRIFTFKS